MDATQLEVLLQRAEAHALEPEDYQTIRLVLESYFQLTSMVGDKRTTIARLRRMLFGASTESFQNVAGGQSPGSSEVNSSEATSESSTANSEVGTDPAVESDAAATAANKAADPEAKTAPKGHGRNGVEDYPGAEKVPVPHESLQPGDPCPECQDGTVYEVSQPGVLIRFVGQAPIQATIYRLQKLRCGLCGVVFTAQPPEGVGAAKYDESVGSMIAMLKYGYGLPFHRCARLQDNLEIPVPSSTQWDLVEDVATQLVPIHEELIRQAAQGDVVHNDDTKGRILELMGNRGREVILAEAAGETGMDPDRTGIWTSGIVSTNEGRQIALFFTGRQHAGENLLDVLREREEGLARPIQMCDALSRNMPGELRTIIANCLAHGRRNFVEIYDRFEHECKHVLEALAIIYKNDELARKQKMTRDDRLRFHQAESASVMTGLHTWMTGQIDGKLVEPNSALGEAIRYMLKHWTELTLFLREPGAPLDNNICERALKRAIRHRKNSLFYKTRKGARVGDLFMSLIYTCELNRINAFDYLTELQRHAEELAVNAADWMPWNYRATIEAATLATC